jgi:hypothetical protein
MNHGLSDQVRTLARAKYVQPAILTGQEQFSIPVRALLQDLQSEGFPARNTPQVCTALQTSKFLRENGLEIECVDGPPKKMSTTVVVHYRVTKQAVRPTIWQHAPEDRPVEPGPETPEEWAHRLTGKLCGLLKEELAEYGGGEAFLRWIRSEDEGAA